MPPFLTPDTNKNSGDVLKIFSSNLKFFSSNLYSSQANSCNTWRTEVQNDMHELLHWPPIWSQNPANLWPMHSCDFIHATYAQYNYTTCKILVFAGTNSGTLFRHFCSYQAPFLSQQEGHLTGIKYKNPELNLSEWPGPYCIHINSLKSSFFAGAIPVKYRVYVQFWLCNYHLVDVAQNFSGAPPSV